MKTLIFAAVLLLSGAPLHAQPVSSGSLRLALIEDAWTGIRVTLGASLDALLRQSPSSGTLQEVLLVPAYFSGGDYRFRIPRAQFTASSMTAAALETDTETALIFPAPPELVAGLFHKAADPATFKNQWTVRVSSRPVTVLLTQGLGGEGIVSALLDPQRGEGAQWHNSAVIVHRLSWQGQDVSMAVVGHTFGSLGRLAAALERERKSGPPVLGLSRGGVFGTLMTDLKGRALADALHKLGLSYSAVGPSELRHWGELRSYLKEQPDGIRFLSANLVQGKDPVFADHVLTEVGGLRVALIGLTPPSAAHLLPETGLTDAAILDPVAVVGSLLPRLRGQADLVVLLTDLGPESSSLARQARGADLLLAEDQSTPWKAAPPAEARLEQADRRPFETPLWTMRAYDTTFDVLEASLSRSQDKTALALHERHVLLDQDAPSAAGFPEFDPEALGITLSTEPALLPPASRIFPVSSGLAPDKLYDGGFWAMAASLLAGETGSELAVLPAQNMAVQPSAPTEIKEGVVRSWLQTGETTVLVRLSGRQIAGLLDTARRQEQSRDRGELAEAALVPVVGGLGPDRTVHGLPIEYDAFYRVATARTLALAQGWAPEPLGPRPLQVDDAVLASLRRRRGSPPESYRAWMDGLPVSDSGLWKVNFRDVALSLQNTKVVRDDAFDTVPNSRVQGYDELLIGGVFKTDIDYLRSIYKWSSSVELEYARSRLRPRNQSPVNNLTANRLGLMTTGTLRAGAVLAPWLARSWGPSLGLQYEGQLENTPPLRRKQIYYVYPGLEFYDGTFVRTLRLAGNIKRDLSRDPPDTQYGLRARTLFSKSFGAAPATMEGEIWANYFFLTNHDKPQDLRWEGDANLKLRVPIRKHLTISPFVDFYFFQLKTRPLWGYSAMTGVTIGFSRLWKPQYEKF